MSDVILKKKVRNFDGFFALDTYYLQHKKYDGSMSPTLQREIFERGHAIAVLPYDKNTDEIIFIEQFRVGAWVGMQSNLWQGYDKNPHLTELVAGLVEGEDDIAYVAKKEMLEEIGTSPIELYEIAPFFTSPGATSEAIFLFFAIVDGEKCLNYGGADNENEDIKITKIKSADAFELMKSNKIINATTLILLQWFYINYDDIIAGKFNFTNNPV